MPPVFVGGILYTHAAELQREFDRRKSRLFAKCGPRPGKHESDHGWLWELIQGHVRGQEKIGGAIDFALSTDFKGDIDITLVKADGGRVSVGKDGLVKKRFAATHDTNPTRDDVLRTMRALVRLEVAQVRRDAGATGMGATLHVGHMGEAFASLVVRWFREGPLRWPHGTHVDAGTKLLRRIGPESGDFELAGTQDVDAEALRADWCEFHAKHAKLEMQDAHANVSDNYNNKRQLWQAEGKPERPAQKKHGGASHLPPPPSE